jgi:hypothetical protein
MRWGNGGERLRRDIPESLLDAADIVHLPVLFGDILLAKRDAGPGDTHLGNTIDIILVEVDLQRAEVTLRPLRKTPRLDNLLRLVESNKLSSDIAVEDGELAADLGAIELARRAACERSNALRVRESAVELAGCGAELVRGGHSGCVHNGLAGLGGGGSLRGGGPGGLGLRVDGGLGEAAGWVDAGSVLEVLGVLGDQGAGEFGQGLAELGDELCAHQVLYGLLGVGIGLVLDFELVYGC